MKKKLKVAILVSHPIQYFSPMYREFASEEKVDLKVYYLSRQGLEAYHDKGFGAEVKWDISLTDGFEHQFIKNIRKVNRIGGFFSLINPGVVNALRVDRPDLLIIHGNAYLSCILALLIAKVLKIKVAFYGDSNIKFYQRKKGLYYSGLRKKIMILFYRLFDHFLVIGTMNRRYYKVHGVPEKKMIHFPFAVNNDFFIRECLAAREKKPVLKGHYNISSQAKIVLFVSKLTLGKRTLDVVKACSALFSSDLYLVITGSGPEKSTLEDFVDHHNIKNVVFTGFKNQTELPEIFALADVFVFPAEKESWGLIVNEAMCAGLPVICSDEVGAAEDLVEHGVNGYLFSPGDIESLKHNIYKLLFEDDHEKMGHESLAKIKRWNYRVGIDCLMKTLLK